MPEPDHDELHNIINEKEARIRALEEKIKEYESTINALIQQHQSFSNDIKQLKEEIDELKSSIHIKEKEKKDLQKEVKQLKNRISEKDSRCNRIEQKLKNNKNSHDNEMKQLKENSSREMEKINKKIEILKKKHEKDMRSMQSQNEDLKKERASLQEENNNLKKVPNPLEQYYLCIGQLCSDLQANMYEYVLPDDFSGKGWSYKFWYIEKDIKNIGYTEEKRQASERFAFLKEKIKWDDKFEGVLDMLQSKRNQIAHPEILNAEAAQEAAEKLNKEGKWQGKMSYEKVLRVIKMWEETVELLNQNNQ